MSATKSRAVEPATYVGVIFKNRRYPNHRQRLPELGGNYAVKFKGGIYLTKSAEEEAALRKLRGKGIAPYKGIPIYECGLCRFNSTDEEEVEWHRRETHASVDLID